MELLVEPGPVHAAAVERRDDGLDLVPLPLIVWREDGTIVAVNAAACALLGRPRELLLARSYWSLSAATDPERELTALRHGELPLTKLFAGPDARPIAVEVVGATAIGDAWSCVLTRSRAGRDIEAALRRQHAILLDLSRGEGVDAGDVAAALPRLTEAAATGVGCERSSVWLYTDGEASIRCLDLYTLSDGRHQAGALLQARDFPAYFAALAEDRTIAAADAHTHPATREFSQVYLAPLGISSMLEAPIRRHGRLVGVLCNEHVGPARAFTQDEQNFAASIADLVARLLDAAERRRVEDALARTTRELERHAVGLQAQVDARTAALLQSDAENRGLIDRLERAALALSTPVIEVWHDVLAMPIVGVLDPQRGRHMTERILEALHRTRARHVIIDLTGVEIEDAPALGALVQLARAARLLGAECVLTGLRAEHAARLVAGGLDLSGLRSERTIQRALAALLPTRA